MIKTLAVFCALLCATSTYAKSADEAKTLKNNLEVCRSKLKLAHKLDVLYDLQWKPPEEPMVVVGPIFETLTFDAKEGFAETVNCFVNAGDTRNCINFSLLDYQTHHEVARYSLCHLSVN